MKKGFRRQVADYLNIQSIQTMKRSILFLALFLGGATVKSQVNLEYYLTDNISYNVSVPTPEQFAGHEVGEWHLTHDKLYFYMIELAKVSDRALWEEYGRSHEKRPLGQLIISSEENIRNMEELRQQHLQLCDPSKSENLDISSMPVFIKLGYGVHGNESSASNSSVLIAYYLIAGEGKQIDELLDDAVIMVDPSLNPDGMQRHSTWVNFTRSMNNNPDPSSWEFSESWPGGRTNHYWFDLNRDYIMLQHPESVGRVAAFHKWKPNINTDHHEMGANATFFFQPGIQSRNNPLTPPENQELTAEIGRYHEKYLNAIGSLYYTEETYDDFYLGKGSSYPDIHGSVGILFEQAGVRGHLRETPGGSLSFPFAIRNQFTVSLSSLEAGLRMREKLLESQRKFYKDALIQSEKHPVKAYIFTEPTDNARISEFIRNLLRHQIKICKLNRDIIKDGIQYKAENSFIVPLRQPEYLFIRSLFEPVKEFTDSIFYDVSTWVLPMSFNIQYTGITSLKELAALTGTEITGPPMKQGQLLASEDAYAYLFEWNEYFAPKALYLLQKVGLTARVSTREFTYDDGSLRKSFSPGTILIPAHGQLMRRDAIYSLMDSVANDCRITVFGVKTGLTTEGIDLGSSAFNILKKPSVIMITGEGTSSSDIGEIWHLLDTRFNIPVTMVTAARIANVDLSRYNVLIISGSPDLGPSGTENIREWNRRGGTIIAYKGGNTWISRNKFAELDYIPSVVPDIKEGIYINRSANNQVHQIPGSIFETVLDLTHPLCYGYTRNNLPVFKRGTSVVRINSNIYNNPVRYTENPLLSGYCTEENIERIKGTAFASVHRNGIISIYDNTNFRAIWYGTTKIFLNALFFGQIMDN
jgi:hypothetical protein